MNARDQIVFVVDDDERIAKRSANCSHRTA